MSWRRLLLQTLKKRDWYVSPGAAIWRKLTLRNLVIYLAAFALRTAAHDVALRLWVQIAHVL
jgi:hypothetical protein